jgi:IMP dehydrogenase
MTSPALTYDDIQLVPGFSSVSSRQKIKLETKLSRNHNLLMPLVASPMDTVCEEEMAYKMFLMGGVGCIHRFMSIEEQCKQVKALHYKIYGEGFGGPFENWGEDYGSGKKAIPIMAAIGVGEEGMSRADALVQSGVNVLLIDVAHGHHQNVIDMISYCKENHPNVDVIAGNIATAEAAEDLQNAGADGLRVGIGGGSLCTTRIKTGFGIPNVTCIEEISRVAKVPVMADGGIRSSGDIAKALGVGAHCVMIGSLIAGTDEAPGKIIETRSGLSKRYRGSASLETKSAHGQEQRNVEGESTTIPYKGGVKFVINGLLDGVRSALSYAGSEDLDNFHPKYIQVTNSGLREAQPHLI